MRSSIAGTRRPLLRRAAATCLLAIVYGMSAGCAVPPAAEPPWLHRLTGNSLVLLGEVHDNASGQGQRLATLRLALARGWRPAIVLEQFDIDRQPQIDLARSERPRDASHLIEMAGGKGWDWPLYRPLVQLALDHGLPLRAVNLPRSLTSRIVREDAVTVLGAGRACELGIDAALPASWLAAQQREIADGHCGALPESVLPGMARAQAARDAVMARELARWQDRGAVLIAGNGHVRRDLGVAWWLQTAQRIAAQRIWAVGYLESGGDGQGRFDAVVKIAPQMDRPDPCLQFRR